MLKHINFPLIIAEVAQAHDGSLGMAHSYIDAAANAGAGAIKFQTHIASSESTLDEPFRIKMSSQDKKRYDYWKRMEFTKEQWKELKNHAEEKNLLFLSSAFSEDAVDLLEELGMKYWKIPSGQIFDEIVFKKILQTKKPLLLSTGMSTYNDIDNIVNRIKINGNEYAIFQCTSSYPTSLKEIGINILDEMKNKYNCHVGLSDHSGSIFPSLLALSKNSSFVEVHVTFSKQMYGPDVKSSVTFEELTTICDAAKAFKIMNENELDKNKTNLSLKKLFTKSISLKTDLPSGTNIEEKHITTKKPGIGIKFENRNQVIGKKLKKSVKANKLLKLKDFQ